MRARVLAMSIPLSLLLGLGIPGGVTANTTPAPAPEGTTSTPEPESVDTAGIPLVELPEQLTPPSPEAAQALHDAWIQGMESPKDLGYPWIDEATGEVVVDTVTKRGLQVAEANRAKASRPTRTRQVSRSFAALEQVKHEVIGLTSAEVPDGDAIFETIPDPANNRIIISVDKMSTALFSALAERYGTETISVRFAPDEPRGEPQPRDRDTSPFYGGATIRIPSGGTCSSGFSWYSGSTSMMLTAGHCAPSGGSISTPATSMGSVTSGSRENWTNGTGTVYLTGQSTYRGDLALIQIASNKSSNGRIYRGGAGSNSSAPVKEMWSRMAATGDQYCTGGYRTGELCGWSVTRVRFDHRYSNGEVVRNANRGSKQGQCNLGGDSGGPVYTVRSDGGIAAKGIHSGGGGGGSDNWGGALDPCFEIFTDIWDAYYAFPGVLRLG
jgi:streptogrisin C